MPPFVEQLNHLLGLAIILTQLFVIAVAGCLVFEYRTRRKLSLVSLVATHALPAAFLIALTGTGFSLFYSEGLGFLPCGLCWFQRILLYPQVVVGGMAIYKKDRGIADYLIGLSIPGVIIASYHHYLQMGGTSILPCPAAVGNCAQRFLFELGYITFPLMAATAFLAIIVLMLAVKTRPGNK